MLNVSGRQSDAVHGTFPLRASQLASQRASQQCTQMAQNGAEGPFSPICVHSCVSTATRTAGRGHGSHDIEGPMAPVMPERSDLRPTPPGR